MYFPRNANTDSFTHNWFPNQFLCLWFYTNAWLLDFFVNLTYFRLLVPCWTILAIYFWICLTMFDRLYFKAAQIKGYVFLVFDQCKKFTSSISQSSLSADFICGNGIENKTQYILKQGSSTISPKGNNLNLKIKLTKSAWLNFN